MIMKQSFKMKLLAAFYLASASVISAAAIPEDFVLGKVVTKTTAGSDVSYYPPMQFTPNVLNRVPDRMCVNLQCPL